MKTAISIPDALFREAEEFAKEHGLSRSELYARAVELYLRGHRYSGVTQMLDAVYGEGEEAGKFDSAIVAAQSSIISRDDW